MTIREEVRYPKFRVEEKKEEQSKVKKERLEEVRKLFPFVLIFLFFLLGIYFKKKIPFYDKVLLRVNGEEVKKSFLEKKIKNKCLIKKEDEFKDLIDFLILREEAEKLGIKVSQEELNTLFDEKKFPRLKVCPEEFLKEVLKARIREKVSFHKDLEALIFSGSIPEAEIMEVIFLVRIGQSPNLWAAANLIFSQEKFVDQPPFFARQLMVSPDSLGQGVFVDRVLFETAFALKEGGVSNPIGVKEGPLKDKIVVLRVIKSWEEGRFAGFDDWFSEVKKKAKVKIY